jgi:hypothetical protein
MTQNTSGIRLKNAIAWRDGGDRSAHREMPGDLSAELKLKRKRIEAEKSYDNDAIPPLAQLRARRSREAF